MLSLEFSRCRTCVMFCALLISNSNFRLNEHKISAWRQLVVFHELTPAKFNLEEKLFFFS